MLKNTTTPTRCPHCGRRCTLRNHRYSRHHNTHGDYCLLSELPAPANGNTADAYQHRATIVTHLATLLRDQDPAHTYAWLTTQPHHELVRLMVVACAAIPTHQRLSQIYEWIYQLPAGKQVDP